MRAVVYQGPGKVAVEQVAEPKVVESTDAVVRVTLAGICGTDLHAVNGDFPGMTPGTVIGHEFVGEVVELGRGVQRIRLGDTVMASDFTACGRCRWCDRAEHWHCSERAFFGTGTAFGPPLPGAQAEFVRVPHADKTLGLLPPACSAEAALLMADNLATAWVAMERSRTQPGETVAVIGGGAIGQLVALAAQTIGAGAVAVVEPSERRRAFAQRHGSLAVHPDAAADLLARLTDGDGADVVVEAVGASAALDLSAALVRPCGRIVSVGAHVAERWDLPVARAFREELTLSFAIGDAMRVRRRLLQVVTSGALDPTVVIEARGTLDQAPELYARLGRQEILKAVVSP